MSEGDRRNKPADEAQRQLLGKLPGDHRSSRGSRRGGAGKASPLAVASLVSSLLLCCPVTSIAAVVLGAMALHRIRMSRGMVSGRRLAIAGILIGSASFVIQASMYPRLIQALRGQWEQEMTDRVQGFLDTAAAGDIDAAMAHWSKPSQPSPEQVETFIEAATQRYGSLQQVTVTHFVTTGGVFDGAFEAAMTFRFEQATLIGTARFLQRGELGMPPPLAITSISIDGEDGAIAIGDKGEADRKGPAAAP